MIREALATLAVVTTCVFASTTSSSAAIVLTTGDVVEIAAPASVATNQNESDTNIHVFAEQAGVVLGSPLDVDMTAPDTIFDPPTGGSPGTIPAGTTVNSYYLQLDPVSGSKRLKGAVTFAEPILGVIAISDPALGGDKLSPSNVLGAPGTTYPAPAPSVGLEASTDNLRLYSSTLALDMVANVVDHVRVITAPLAPPDPTEIGSIGKKLAIKDRYRDALPWRRSLAFKSSGDAILPLLVDPQTTGAFVHVYSASDSWCTQLDASRWAGTGAYGHVYNDSFLTAGPCSRAVMAGNTLKLKCPGGPPGSPPIHPITLDEPSQGTIYVDVTFGPIRYCTVFDGSTGVDYGVDLANNPDDYGFFGAANQPAPVVCPTPPSPCP
jgi:hypothetical protein